MPSYKLRQVINYLQLNEYLAVTNDEYAVVKLTEKSRAVLEEGEPVVMKMAKEQEHPAKVKAEKGKKSRKGLAAGLRKPVFRKRRSAVRSAPRAAFRNRERGEVPPYIVFSDKTLTHMCVIKPKTRAEMLTVTGVGEFKFEKYGERFWSVSGRRLEQLTRKQQRIFQKGLLIARSETLRYLQQRIMTQLRRR